MSFSNVSFPVPPIFSSENFDFWAVNLTTFFRAHDLWDVVDAGKDPTPLPPNPTLA